MDVNRNTEAVDSIDVFTEYVMDASSYFMLLRESAGMFIDLLKETQKRYRVINGRLLAELMCDLFNIHGMRKKKPKLCKGLYFRCSVKSLEIRYWPDYLQERLLPMLRKFGLIESQQFGFSRIRYVLICYKKWRELLTSFLVKKKETQVASPTPSTSCSPPSQYVLKYNETKGNIKESVAKLPLRNNTNTFKSTKIPNKEKGMSFVPELDKKQDKPNKWDFMWADQIRATIRGRFKSRETSSRLNWAEMFRLLRTQTLKNISNPIVYVSNLLDWYCANVVKDPEIPTFNFSTVFRKKFDWLIDKYEKYNKTNPDVKITKDVKSIIKRLCYQTWPGGITEKDLEVPVQITYDNFQDFYGKLYDYREKINGSDRFAQHMSSVIGTPDSFTEMWWDIVYSGVNNWDKWNGDLMGRIWDGDVRNKKFYGMLMSKASAYGADKNDLNKLFKRMGY